MATQVVYPAGLNIKTKDNDSKQESVNFEVIIYFSYKINTQITHVIISGTIDLGLGEHIAYAFQQTVL